MPDARMKVFVTLDCCAPAGQFCSSFALTHSMSHKFVFFLRTQCECAKLGDTDSLFVPEDVFVFLCGKELMYDLV